MMTSMRARTVTGLTLLTLLACLAMPFGASAARPKRRPHGSQPVAPATPPSVPSPPALSNEPEPMAAPAAPAPSVSTPAPAAPAPYEAQPVKTKSAVELDGLVNEYSAIRDELFRSRAKAAVLGEALLKTSLEVSFRYEAGRAWPLRKLMLRLDERPVFSADSVTGTDMTKVFETVAAPGRHVLTVRVEANGTGEDRISYATENAFGFDIADGKITRVEINLDEVGSGPATIAKKKEGSFDLRVKANVKSITPEKK